MTGRRRDVLVLLLPGALGLGTYAAAVALGVDRTKAMGLGLLWAAPYLVWAFARFLLDRLGRWRRGGAAAGPAFAPEYPVYVLHDPAAGLALGTAEPAGGMLAVFTGPEAAARFAAARQVTGWTPTALTPADLLDLLGAAERYGRVGHVIVDPAGDGRGTAWAYPLSHCLDRLRATVPPADGGTHPTAQPGAPDTGREIG